MTDPDDSFLAWAIFETHPQGLIVADASGRFRFVNGAAERILGVPLDLLKGLSLFDPRWEVMDSQGHPLSAGEVPAAVAMQTGKPQEQRKIGVRQAAGDILWLEVTAGPLPGGGVAVTFQDITQVHLTEQALRAHQAQTQSMLLTALDGICLVDRDGTILEANPAAERMLGYSDGALVHKHIQDIECLEAPEETRAHLLQVIRDGAATFSTIHRRRDGSQYFADVSTSYLPERDQFVVFFRDISEKQKAIEALKEERERFQAIVDSVDGIVWEGDATTFQFTFVSAKAVDLLGYATEDWRVPGFWAEHLHPEDRDIAIQFCVGCTGRLEDHDFEYRFQKQDGDYIWLRDIVTVSPDANGKPRWLRGVMVDITAQKQIELSLRESERFLSEAQEAGNIGTYSWDIGKNQWKSSPVLNRIFGIDDAYPHDLDAWEALVAPDHRAMMAAYIRELVATRQPFNREYQVQRPDGSLRWVHGHGNLHFDGHGNPTHLAGVIQDITERKAREREHLDLQQHLARTQRLESLGSLAGGIAHDMNNVLGAILGMSSLHEELAPEGSPLRKGMGTITLACKRGRELVQGLLSFARQGLAEQRLLDLNTLIREQVALLERTTLQRIRLETVLSEDLRPVTGDGTTLAHALLNLCVNAVDAMPEGGSLAILTGNEGVASVQIQIIDTGSGMPPEVLEKAMDPFFTTKPQGKGTGLGLSIVFAAVKAHGGEFRLESAPGSGTRAILTLPAQVGTATTMLSGAVPRIETHNRLSVLVVDDDPLVQDTFEQLIHALGHQVSIAPGGREALALLEAGLQPDCIILDMNMPGMTGAEALPHLRTLRPNVPVILATGRADQDAINLCKWNPRVTLLPKPFSAEELSASLAGSQ